MDQINSIYYNQINDDMSIVYLKEKQTIDQDSIERNISALIKFEEAFLKSYEILDASRKLNLFSVCIVILVGLVGHFLTILVFSKKRFRTNPSNVL